MMSVTLHRGASSHRPRPAGQGRSPRCRQGQGRAGQLGALAVQVVIVGALLGLYNAGRLLVEGRTAEAFRNARQLWAWERRWHLPSELSLERWVLVHPLVAQAADLYYAWIHFPLTFATLLGLFLYRRELYRWTRDVLLVMTAGALALIFAWPMAPPRMMTGLGFTDVAVVFGQSVYHADALSNQYASMPSLHVGWAALVAVALIRAGHSRWRWLWLLHPLATVLVVIGTANHYWSDVLAGLALFLLAVSLVALARRWISRWRQGRSRADPAPAVTAVKQGRPCG